MYEFFGFSNTIVILIFVISYITSMFLSGIEVAFLTSFPAIFPESDTRSLAKQKQVENILNHPVHSVASIWFLKSLFSLASVACLFFIGSGWFQISLIGNLALVFSLSLFMLAACFSGSSFLAQQYPLFFLRAFYTLSGLFLFVSGKLSSLLFGIRNALQQLVWPNNQSLLNIAYSQRHEMQEGSVSDEEILKGIVKFGQIEVREILRPRVDVVAVEMANSLTRVLEVVVESGYSRIPVFSGNFDNVRGVLFVKDLLPYISAKETFRWQSLVRPSYFVPETKKVKDLLTEFKTSKIHMAIVVDEYGGTLGIVTLEDILEEIVGEISDESDEDEKYYTKINDNTYIFDGKIQLNDFQKVLQTDNDVFDSVRGDADTLAGLLLELKGAIPAKNEQIVFKQFNFRIIGVDARRIKQIKVTIAKD